MNAAARVAAALAALVTGPSVAAFVAVTLGCYWGESRRRKAAGVWRSDVGEVTRILSFYAVLSAVVVSGAAAWMACAAQAWHR